jgi:hypothetical protein
MPQPTPRRFSSWRLSRPPAATPPDALAHRMTPPLPGRGVAVVPAELKAEAPGPDGIRHGLVAHVRRLIAEGAYDTPERWEVAEERLLARALGR